MPLNRKCRGSSLNSFAVGGARPSWVSWNRTCRSRPRARPFDSESATVGAPLVGALELDDHTGGGRRRRRRRRRRGRRRTLVGTIPALRLLDASNPNALPSGLERPRLFEPRPRQALHDRLTLRQNFLGLDPNRGPPVRRLGPQSDPGALQLLRLGARPGPRVCRDLFESICEEGQKRFGISASLIGGIATKTYGTIRALSRNRTEHPASRASRASMTREREGDRECAATARSSSQSEVRVVSFIQLFDGPLALEPAEP